MITSKIKQAFIMFVEPEFRPSVVEVQTKGAEAETVSILIGYLQPEKEAKIFDRLFYYIPLETKKKVLPVTEEMRNTRYLVLHTQDDKRFAFSAVGTPKEYTVEELQAMGYNAGKHGIRYLGFELTPEPNPPFDINAIQLREGDERRAPDFKKMKKVHTYIDLFCGSGGMSLGFEAAGFENIFSIDFNKDCYDTYSYNFPTHDVICGDISRLTKEDIIKRTHGKTVDVVIGGPPCQGFSMAGNIGRRFVDDPRNHLFREFARVVSIVKPQCFVMENVARLYTHNHGETRQEIIRTFEELGYKVDCKVLNAADYGVPQKRYRVVFIGTRKNKTILFPLKCVEHYKTVEETIGDLPILESGQSSNVPNHNAMVHTAQMLHKMSFVTDGGNREDIPESIRPKKGDIRKYIRYNSKEPSICITGDMRKVFHYNQNRALTVRELADIQTYPRTFIFKGNTISQQQQVGNSVPPLLAYHIAKAILPLL